MDDLSAKLSELLSSPDAAEKLREAADALLGRGSGEVSPPAGGIDAAALSRVISTLNSGANDERAALLTALRPHLSEERRARVDRAIKLINIVRLLPLIRAEGLLDL